MCDERAATRRQSLDFLPSIVRIFVTSIEPDFAAPWDRESPAFSTGSGFIIQDPRSPDKRLIITNAHCVDSATEVLVQKFQSDVKTEAKVLTQIIDCDVAILTVRDEKFWTVEHETGPSKRMPFLTFGPLPKIQDEVRVVGYPEYGSELAVTQGCVSRIQHQNYVHSGIHLLSMQTTARIASGNSGGPVMNTNDEVVGIAFQGTERVGEFIPNTVFSRFLELPVDGSLRPVQTVAGAGFNWERLESDAIRKSLGMLELSGTDSSGILVSSVNGRGEIAEILRPGDVIVEIDGVSIGNVGTIILDGNRIGFMHLITSKAVGDSVDVVLLREGNRQGVSWRLDSADSSALVPMKDKMKLFCEAPDYVLIGGLVFVRLSLEVMGCLEDVVDNEVLVNLFNHMRFGFKRPDLEEIVIVSKLLPNEAVKGYDADDVQGRVVSSFNGEAVTSLGKLADIYMSTKESDFYTIGLEIPNVSWTTRIVLDRKQVVKGEKDLLKEYRIPVPIRIGLDESAFDNDVVCQLCTCTI